MTHLNEIKNLQRLVSNSGDQSNVPATARKPQAFTHLMER